RVAKPHPGHATGDARRLERVVPGRFAGLDVAEPTAPGAGVAEDHERGGPPLPALADVRTRRLLTDGVEVLRFDQALELAVLRTPRRRHLEPGRLAAAMGLDVGPEHAEHITAAGV